MKVIDLYLAIEENKNIPKKVVYKYNTYRYYPEYKQYYREEDDNMISLFLEANCDDRIYLIEDTPKEDISNLKWAKYVIKEDVKKCSEEDLRTYISLIMETQNEIIDRLNGKGNE